MPDDTVHQQPQSQTPDAVDQVVQTPVAQQAVEQVVDTPKVHGEQKPVAAIVLAVAVCLGLVGGVIYAQISRPSESPVATVNRVTSTQELKQSQEAVAPNVDAAISDATSLARQADEQNADISDQALGL